MIASLSGQYRSRSGESLVLDVGGVGYLIYLPPVVWSALGELHPGQPLCFEVVYTASAQQPKPTLFGFLSVEGMDPGKLYGWLLEKYRIVTTPITHPEFAGIRVTPNVYTTPDEVDLFSEKVLEAVRKGVA